MLRKRKPMDAQRKATLKAAWKREGDEKAKTYREQALKMFPHVCQRCGREFSGARLRELTVHHKDGNHMNNPPDGSNWALLCLYCHDDEHGAYEHIGVDIEAQQQLTTTPSLGFQAFEGLRATLASAETPSESE